MSIQAKINELKPYVSGFKFHDNKVIVEVNLKEHWQKPIKGDKNFIWVDDDKNNNVYYVVGDEIKVGVDSILEHVKRVISINIEKDKKNILFKEKIRELKEFFKSNSYEDLSTMKFNLNKSFSKTHMEEENEETFYDGNDIDNELSGDSPQTDKDDDVSLTHKEGLNHQPTSEINESPSTYKEKDDKSDDVSLSHKEGLNQPRTEIKEVDETVYRKNVKGQNIDLPKKGEKVELQEFNAPKVPDV